MGIALGVEFPDEQAALVFEWLQSLPDGLVANFEGRKHREPAVTPATKELSEAEQQR